MVGARRLMTISLPPELLKKAEGVAKQENRTKSELVREAIRFYVDTSELRRRVSRDRLFGLIDEVQARTRSVPPQEIRKLVHDAVEAARRGRPRASA